MPRSAPWRASVLPHLRRRHRWTTAVVNRGGAGTKRRTRCEASNLPAAVNCDEAAKDRLDTGRLESGFADHCAEGLHLWKAADRFDQVAIARFVVGDRLAD